ncbi:HD-GYP domain-containing protein [Litoribrevibacter albus]|uniref:Phosphodiesterase n=1 Tax=Litoribrevibacter albus TaxID=1473156 RepID=A0AA37S9Q3_9GAMM|nr:HD-GYP domain-containing protein [Litoribrevibacter albus]GLQ30924.1 phosphodiesterase [Litoribrevibacter albus]
MIKKIPIDLLVPEMYVTGFHWDQDVGSQYQKEGRVPDQKTVEIIRSKGVRYVFIDNERGIDVDAGVSVEQIEQQGNEQLEAYANEKPMIKKSVSRKDELEKARKVHTKAKGLVNDAMKKALKGDKVEIHEFKEVANEFIDSVGRNQNALACLSRIREKDSYLLEHSVNVGVLMSILGKAMDLERQTLFEYVLGALLHDIGKILIPDDVLHKPGRLTEAEFELMKKHSTFSRDILVKSGGLPQASINVAYQHHERLDGTGYPGKLDHSSISLEGKMAAVVDVYDAITADRCYHKGMPPTIALKRMLEWTGDHLDKELVHLFIRAMGIYPVGSLVELNNQRLAVVEEVNEEDQKRPVVKVIYNAQYKRYVNIELLDLSKKKDFAIVKPVDPSLYGININDFIA